MTDRIIKTASDLNGLVSLINARKLPFTVRITGGKHRTIAQNRLQRMWCIEIADQRGDVTPEEVRGEIKLRFGVPILRAEHDEFCEKYDRIIKPHTYEDKVEMMMEPLDFPVTRLMTIDQKSRYLDAVYQYHNERGFVLTERGE